MNIAILSYDVVNYIFSFLTFFDAYSLLSLPLFMECGKIILIKELNNDLNINYKVKCGILLTDKCEDESDPIYHIYGGSFAINDTNNYDPLINKQMKKYLTSCYNYGLEKEIYNYFNLKNEKAKKKKLYMISKFGCIEFDFCNFNMSVGHIEQLYLKIYRMFIANILIELEIIPSLNLHANSGKGLLSQKLMIPKKSLTFGLTTKAKKYNSIVTIINKIRNKKTLLNYKVIKSSYLTDFIIKIFNL